LGKIEEKKRLKKEALLEAAYQLFTEKGIDDTSVSEIVEEAKMAKGTFYLYFKDKYEIRDCLVASKANQIFERASEQLNHQLIQLAEDSIDECIVLLVDAVLDQLAESPSLLRFVSKNLSWGIFSKLQISDLDNRNCMDIFESLLQLSNKKYRQKELMIYMIVELVNASCYNVILNHVPVELDELKKELYTAIRNILHQFEYVAAEIA
jgi:AcrR family transcriptional regulator